MLVRLAAKLGSKQLFDVVKQGKMNHPVGPQPFGGPHTAPSSVSTITAGVLALGGGMLAAYMFTGAAISLHTLQANELFNNSVPLFVTRLVFHALLSAAIAFLLGLGGLRLLTGKSVGRPLVVAGAALALAVVIRLMCVNQHTDLVETLLEPTFFGIAATVLFTTLLPSTGRWLQTIAHPAGAAGYPYS
ncbi:hypothetical protein AB0M13_19295 [Nocardia fluminea]|uniref:hypothetical protein n=1 Tax=Nocardia fluminea TaxID=134984 RepID=UPI00342BC149